MVLHEDLDDHESSEDQTWWFNPVQSTSVLYNKSLVPPTSLQHAFLSLYIYGICCVVPSFLCLRDPHTPSRRWLGDERECGGSNGLRGYVVKYPSGFVRSCDEGHMTPYITIHAEIWRVPWGCSIMDYLPSGWVVCFRCLKGSM